VVEEQIRLLGVIHGIVSGLATVQIEIRYLNLRLSAIPERHVIKRTPLMYKIEALKNLYNKTEKDLRRLQEIWEERDIPIKD
jgi:hypothetical protein